MKSCRESLLQADDVRYRSTPFRKILELYMQVWVRMPAYWLQKREKRLSDIFSFTSKIYWNAGVDNP